jgi:hypothetical protein
MSYTRSLLLICVQLTSFIKVIVSSLVLATRSSRSLFHFILVAPLPFRVHFILVTRLLAIMCLVAQNLYLHFNPEQQDDIMKLYLDNICL